jgi:hypothetical protein
VYEQGEDGFLCLEWSGLFAGDLNGETHLDSNGGLRLPRPRHAIPGTDRSREYSVSSLARVGQKTTGLGTVVCSDSATVWDFEIFLRISESIPTNYGIRTIRWLFGNSSRDTALGARMGRAGRRESCFFRSYDARANTTPA